MINPGEPKHWKVLQSDVAQILSECGFQVELNKTIRTVRGKVDIDVFALDPGQIPPVIYLCECKLWNSNVPKKEVHAFRTVVNDFGANWGLIISKKGFQSGAFEAVQNTNLRLFNWQEFQSLFSDRWYREYMVIVLDKEADPFLEYTEPINSRIFRKADALPSSAQKSFIALREKSIGLMILVSQFCLPRFGFNETLPRLPLIENLPKKEVAAFSDIPEAILNSTSLRELLDLLLAHIRRTVAEFDSIFGGRA